MNFSIDLNTLVTSGVGGLVAYAVYGIRSINAKLSELNGSVKELKIWKVEHEKLAATWHEGTQERVSRLETAFDREKEGV